jgi:hypothetical protein
MRVHSHAVWCAGILSLVLTPLGLNTLRAEDDKKGEAPEVTVSYTSPTVDVQFNGTKIAYKVREMEFPDVRSDTPSKVVTITRETVVKPEAAKELLDAVKAAGFYDLNDEYGVKAGERNYPYEIRIKDGEREKRVVFRSGQDAKQSPEAFAKVEKLLVDFAKRETKIKKE